MTQDPSLPLTASLQLRSQVLRAVGWTLGTLTLIAAVARALVAPLNPQILVLALIMSAVLFALPQFGSREHWSRRLGAAVTLTFLLAVIGTGYLAGGLRAPAMVLVVVVPLIGVVLVGRGFGALMAALIVALLAALVGLHHVDAVPVMQLSGDALVAMRAVMLSVALIVLAAAISIYDRHSQNLVLHFRREALTDPLTGLYNRRYLEMVFPQLLSDAASGRREVWLAMIDIDHFKQINDAHGHDAGDRALQEVAMVLRQLCLKLPDGMAVRIAGDEFAIVSSGNRGHLRAMMERAQQLLTERAYATAPLSISVGIAGPAAGELQTLPALLAAADVGLYRAKRGGRRRVVCVDTTLESVVPGHGRRGTQRIGRGAIAPAA